MSLWTATLWKLLRDYSSHTSLREPYYLPERQLVEPGAEPGQLWANLRPTLGLDSGVAGLHLKLLPLAGLSPILILLLLFSSLLPPQS